MYPHTMDVATLSADPRTRAVGQGLTPHHRWPLRVRPGLGRCRTRSLPPEHLDEGPAGVRRDLENLGVFERMKKDDRVNVPDLYRVGFGLGLKGGAKPVAKE